MIKQLNNPILQRTLKKATKSILTLLLITSLSASLTLLSLVVYYQGGFSREAFERFFGKKDIYAEEAPLENSPFQPRYSNPDSPYSVFGTCYEQVKDWGEYRIYFGYKNTTGKSLQLSLSKFPTGRKVELLPFVSSSSELPPLTDPNTQLTLLPYHDSTKGNTPFFVRVQAYSTEDIVWKTQYKDSDGEVTSRDVRVNVKYLPVCSRDTNGRLIDVFEKGFSSGRTSSRDREVMSVRELDPLRNVNIFVMCSEWELGKDGKGNGRYSAVFGYRNESGKRINLKKSQLFGRDDAIREVVHIHYQLEGENLANLNLLASKTSDEQNGYDPYGNNDLDLSAKDSIKAMSSPIQYLRDGQESYAMLVRGYGASYGNSSLGGYSSGRAEDLVWSIRSEFKDEQGVVYSFGREVRANPLFDEPCGDESLGKSFDPLSSHTQGGDTDSTEYGVEKNEQKPIPIEQSENKEIEGIEVDKDISPNDQSDKSGTQHKNTDQVQHVQSNLESMIEVQKDDIEIHSLHQTTPYSNNSEMEKYVEQPPLVSFGTIFAPLTTEASTTQIPLGMREVGGLDIAEYCKKKNGYYSTLALRDGSNATSWRCNGKSINYNEVCEKQYSNYHEALTEDGLDPYSIRCIGRPPSLILNGGLDLVTYCRETYGVGLELREQSAMGWVCTVDSPQLDFDDVCRYQYGQSSTSLIQDTSDPLSIICILPEGVEVEYGAGATLVDEDVEDDEYDVIAMSEEYFSENDADITIERNGEFFINLMMNVSESVYSGLKQAVFDPLVESNNCAFYDMPCKSKAFDVLWNMGKMVVSYLNGMLRGIGQAVVDMGKMIWDLISNAKGAVTGLFTAINQMLSNPSMFIDLIIGEIVKFASLDIYGKVDYIGFVVGQFIPDRILDILTGGGSLGANISAKIAKALDTVGDTVRASVKTLNIADKLVGKALLIATGVTISLVKVSNRVVMKGGELWDKIQSLPTKALTSLTSLLDVRMRNVVEKVSGLLRVCGVVASAGASLTFASLETSSHLQNSSPYSPLVVFSHIDTEARGRRCPISNSVNGAKGELFVHRLIGGSHKPKKRISYSEGGTRYDRYPDIREGEVLDASGKVIKIAKTTEVKTGYVTYNDKILTQIRKDIELKNRGIYGEVVWTVLPNPEGIIGMDSRLKARLEKAGITVKISDEINPNDIYG